MNTEDNEVRCPEIPQPDIRKDQRGFTLVELIIVIAIMAVLVGFSVANLTRFIEKARQAKDFQNADTITHALATYYTMQGVNGTTVKGSGEIDENGKPKAGTGVYYMAYVWINKDGQVRCSSPEVAQVLEDAGIISGSSTGRWSTERVYYNQKNCRVFANAWDTYQINVHFSQDTAKVTFSYGAVKKDSSVLRNKNMKGKEIRLDKELSEYFAKAMGAEPDYQEISD